MIKTVLKMLIRPHNRAAIRQAIRVRRRNAISAASMLFPPEGVNLGAGEWVRFRWMGLDARNLNTGRITAETKFHLKPKSLRYAYSSMFFEHVDDATAQAILTEISKSLKPNGVFRIVVPDFQMCLDAYRSGNHDFFDIVWGTSERYENWLQHGCEPTLENKLLYTFASYDNGIDVPDWQWPPWHFDPRYFAGPPPAEKDEVRQMALTRGPVEFSAYAVSKVPADRVVPSMGHINAYTKEKLEHFAKSAGFRTCVQNSYRKSVAPVFESEDFDYEKYKLFGAYFDLQK